MRRRKREEEQDNHERWVLSYADFITLLFAFFVVMYSVSQVHEEKYKVLTDSLEAAFRVEPRSLTPIQVGKPALAPGQDAVAHPDLGGAGLREVAEGLRGRLTPLLESGLLTLRQKADWLELAINNRILFPSGKAELLPDATALLSLLGEVLGKFPVLIRVEGHTDNVPVRTSRFPSNWVLSATRAAMVADLLSRHGVAPERLAASGYADTRPIADNGREEGRSQNRRVVLRIYTPGRHRNLEGDFPVPVVGEEPERKEVART